MKTAGMIALSILMVATLFAGCRKQYPDTTNTTVPGTTHSTTQAPRPSVAPTTKPVPPTTQRLPSDTGATSGTDMSRGRTMPRY